MSNSRKLANFVGANGPYNDETIDISDMSPEKMFEEIKRITGKGDDENTK